VSEQQRESRLLTARRGSLTRTADIWRYRELLVGLVRKELKVKYKNSVLGFLWSMLNPALTLVVFYFVFQIVLPNGIPFFAIYLLSGVLVWNLVSASLPAATASVVSNASLVKKVSFPREILPLASIGAGLVHFFLQALVLIGALVIFRYPVGPTYVALLPVALAVLLLFLGALGILLAAINVYMRDTQHFVELSLLAWFWGTPIVYQYRLVADRLEDRAWLIFLNPITAITVTFQRAIYNKVEAVGESGNVIPILPRDAGVGWYLAHLGVVAAGSVVLLFVAMHVFGRLEGNFAEEL
jgi:ABC-2 type transport system permease protein